MTALFTYLVQSSVTLAILFGVYWVFLRRETFFQVNRIYLLMTVLVSFVMPLIPAGGWIDAPAAAMSWYPDPVRIHPESVRGILDAGLPVSQMAGILYLAGLLFLLFRFTAGIAGIYRIAGRSPVEKAGGIRYVLTAFASSPFSFLNMIFISRPLYHAPDGVLILRHEEVHVRQAHSADRIIGGILVMLQWFNPLAWLLNRELSIIHEYLADEGVIRRGYPVAAYQQAILRETFTLRNSFLFHHFSVSPIKKRIIMLTAKRSGRWAVAKTFLVIPAVMLAAMIFSTPASGIYIVQDTKPKSPPKSAEVVQKADVQPSYPGGFEAMSKFLAANIKYPEQARKKKTEGKVFVDFIVQPDGSLTNAKIKKGIGDGCDEETLRVLNLMPKWEPGKLNGKPVAVSVTLPVYFKLDADKAKEQPK